MGAAERLDAERLDADTFLHALGGCFTFQTFDDSGQGRRTLNRILHGTLAEHAATLASLNAKGAGVFVMVGEGDGKGRKAANVRRVRAYFVDLDGAPIAPVQSAPLPPHVVIESSPGRWHAYWWIEGAPLDAFKGVQRALAERFAADAKVCDLPRVMRLPGFLHRKRAPYPVRIADLRDGPRYTHAEFVAAFGLDAPAPQAPKPRALPDTITEGQRNETLFLLACGLVQKGHAAEAVNIRVQRINAERCRPPLCATEVNTIAARASAYGSQGYAALPHVLLDSPQWQALPPPAHDVILTAFRRFNGSNNGNIALAWSDFEGRAGFAKKDTFYRHRALAVQAGILQHTCEGRNTQHGRKPDLFAIPPQWLPQFRQSQKSDLAPVPKKYTPK